jgi:hypothetical protein
MITRSGAQALTREVVLKPKLKKKSKAKKKVSKKRWVAALGLQKSGAAIFCKLPTF